MRGSTAKKLRREAEAETVGMSEAVTKLFYRVKKARFKKLGKYYRSL
jgi:hypothetical protein